MHLFFVPVQSECRVTADLRYYPAVFATVFINDLRIICCVQDLANPH